MRRGFQFLIHVVRLVWRFVAGALDKKDKDVGTGLVGAPACGDVMKLQVCAVVSYEAAAPCVDRVVLRLRLPVGSSDVWLSGTCSADQSRC